MCLIKGIEYEKIQLDLKKIQLDLMKKIQLDLRKPNQGLSFW